AAWVIAQAQARQGHTAQFEEWVDTAHGEDPHHPGVIYDQAYFAFDRGEARKAKSFLEQLDVAGVRHDIAILDAVLAPATPKVGRNDPCPCGSGRKYKQCHLGVDETGLDDRLTWLYRKANWWLGFHHRDEVEAVASIRGRHSPLSTAQLVATDPLIADAVLTEGGRFAEWLDERGALLPGDEAMLAGQWALIGRSVFEVTDIRLDEAMTLRDVRTGDIVDVDERSGTHDLGVGSYLLARPLPTGSDRFQFFGGLTRVPDHALDGFIEALDNDASAHELVALVADTEAPPSLTNRDGAETVFCETTWLLADPEAAAAVLDTTFEPGEEPGSWHWVAQADDEASAAVAAAGGRTLRGSLRVEDDRLVATTNSVERNEQLTGLIAESVADATLVESLQSSLDDVQADRDYEAAVFGANDAEDDEVALPGMLDPTDAPEEIRAVLRKQMDAYEEAWVDESIPALGGATPREALEDPTRRDDLFRLLDQMEHEDASLSEERRALGMRPARLRELLGLEE
ncbi:MAG TPA: SEC-C metal-binding domain-containing protein, partial [Acidimicrobiales bacterium]|nr:SEC-C metal-binding domain-containing protein [Acidimicrobiales bacterium]